MKINNTLTSKKDYHQLLVVNEENIDKEEIELKKLELERDQFKI